MAAQYNYNKAFYKYMDPTRQNFLDMLEHKWKQ